jgi:hypothetical protein
MAAARASGESGVSHASKTSLIARLISGFMMWMVSRGIEPRRGLLFQYLEARRCQPKFSLLTFLPVIPL